MMFFFFRIKTKEKERPLCKSQINSLSLPRIGSQTSKTYEESD